MTPDPLPRPAGAEFVGAFDFDSDSDSWRFYTAAERPERQVGKLYVGS